MALERALHDVFGKENTRGFEFPDRRREVNQVPLGGLFKQAQRSFDGHAVLDRRPGGPRSRR